MFEFVLVTIAILTSPVKSRDTMQNNLTQYQFRFLMFDKLNLEDFQYVSSQSGRTKFKVIQPLKKVYELASQRINFTMILQNLFTSLQEFQTSHCLIVIDNWQNVDIKQTSAIPFMLRTLDLAL